ncbi:succinylglutamate desuccinylase/aspartoacylase family protein [Rubripirellula amarantea]|uniref:Aspartoacylase n=1 Tax=Rubripirellula amarantea TaxID=2527999 RepID=A0A5C5WTM6_9BACT|nr:succinylglutamate desuccinylase/aspartoacylase family protein [Rubripirellula amarantea]MDA8743148.1 succinylglutamate desuccinylase/aspartoacylase family protein [Rubripirellula amarantea]TWT53501.1 aspartoacylase [Rubripirellula amarantea]
MKQESPPRKSIDSWLGKAIPRGQVSEVFLPVSESYSGISLSIPLQIHRSDVDGPTVFVTAALHGDELNGTGAVRELILDKEFRLKKGSLILVPILNLLAFDRHSRYMPDRRDLNRCFPGSPNGSLASRVADTIFTEIVGRCDFGIDLHTASIRRTNYPNVRADMSDPRVAALAKHFGTEVIVDGAGIDGSLRKEACRQGCPTIVLEGGEVWKVEPAIVETAVRGVKNVLAHLDMIDFAKEIPEQQLVVKRTQWVRADGGGFLQFHVRPGQVVEINQPLATNTDLLGHQNRIMEAPFDGVIIGMTTIPAVGPGQPVFHIGKLPKDTDPDELRESRQSEENLEQRTVEDLASNVMVVDHEESRYPES